MGIRSRAATTVAALALLVTVGACGFVGNEQAETRGSDRVPGAATDVGETSSTAPATLLPPTTVATPPSSTTTTTKPPRVADDAALQPACDAVVYLRDTLENLDALGDLEAYHAAADGVLAALATLRDLVPVDILQEASTPGTERVRVLMAEIQQATSIEELRAVLDRSREAGDVSLEGGPGFVAWFETNCSTA